MSDGSDEPLGLVALVAALALGWQKREKLIPDERARLVGLALLAIYGGTVWWELPPLVRTLPAMGAIVFWFGVWRLPSVVLLLLLSLPLVASLQFYAGYPLRVFAAESARLLLNAVSVPVWREGTQLAFNGALIGVDPPCSGIRMLWAAVFFAVALAGRLDLNWITTLGIGGLAVVLAIGVNVVRATLLFFPESGIIHLPGWTHEAVGLACFAGGLWAIFMAAQRFQPRFIR